MTTNEVTSACSSVRPAKSLLAGLANVLDLSAVEDLRDKGVLKASLEGRRERRRSDEEEEDMEIVVALTNQKSWRLRRLRS